MLVNLLTGFVPTLLLVSAHQKPSNAPSSSPFTSSFDKLVASSLERWHCPGFAIAVINGDDTFSKGYGVATFPSKPVTPDTLFYTASTTKSFTAAAVSLLIDDTANSSEAFFWGTPLATLIREDFVLPDEYTTLHTTLEDALSHRTGMPRHDLTYGGPNVTVRDVVQNLRHLPLTAEIRTRWQYCNVMYITISYFVEKWTGKGLGDFLRTRIYQPLGMNHTFFSLKEAQAAASAGGADLATPYYWKNYTQKYYSLPWLDAPQEYVPSGAGATISNVLDYTKWLRCHMTASPPLSPAGHLALHTPRIFTSTSGHGATGFRGADTYALGWEVTNYRGEIMHWHTGGLPGMVTIMLYFPRLQWGMTMMANGGDGSTQQILVFELIDEMMGIKEWERFDWAPNLDERNRLALKTLTNAENVLYPKTPKGEERIPLALPLEFYAGTYTNPGYPTLTLVADNSNTTLHCTLDYEVWPITLTFTHVSSTYFLLYARFFATTPRSAPDDYDTSTDIASKAEFRLNEAGVVAELGVLLEPEMGDAKISFTKKEAMDRSYPSHLSTRSSIISSITPYTKTNQILSHLKTTLPPPLAPFLPHIDQKTSTNTTPHS